MNSLQFAAITKAIDIIDQDLTLDLDKLSDKVGLSKYYLHHLFKSITGKSLMNYVRRRRLSLSLNELMHTKLEIIDIAYEYHFEHEQSYIRAFKQMFGITPAQYRKTLHELPIEQKIDVKQLLNLGQGLVMVPRMCMKPHFYIQGIESLIVHEKNLTDRDSNKQAELFESVYLPQINNVTDNRIYYGYVSYTDTPDYCNNYLTSVEVAEKNKVQPPFVLYEIPTSDYAVFRYIGLHSPYDVSFATLRSLYHYIGGWKYETAYRQAAPYHFERMNLRTCSDQYCEMDIYVPIQSI